MGWAGTTRHSGCPCPMTCTTVVVAVLVTVVTAGQGTLVPATGILAMFALITPTVLGQKHAIPLAAILHGMGWHGAAPSPWHSDRNVN